MKKPSLVLLNTSLLALALLGGASLAQAARVHVAVAANFTAAAKEIAAGFARSTGHRALISFGSTGKLYTQIINGAPFEVFLSADQDRAALALREGVAVAGSGFTYAHGRIALYSTDPGLIDDAGAVLGKPERFKRVAIANPKLAPYGAAAVEVLERLGHYDAIVPRLVRGENIAQTYQFVVSGNAQLGVIALAQLGVVEGGSHWVIPEQLYTPIRQDAVLLNKGAGNPAAGAFLAYLRGAEARAVLVRYGYGVPGTPAPAFATR